jgi:hypothetical protein
MISRASTFIQSPDVPHQRLDAVPVAHNLQFQSQHGDGARAFYSDPDRRMRLFGGTYVDPSLDGRWVSSAVGELREFRAHALLDLPLLQRFAEKYASISA